MKRYITLLLIAIGLASCQEVVDVDLPTEDPRLIVDALIRVDTSSTFTDIRVRLAESSSFFESLQPVAAESVVLFSLTTGQETVLQEIGLESGIYGNNVPFLTAILENETFELRIEYDEQSYVAQAGFVPSVPIDNLVQGDGSLFGEDETEVVITFTDIGLRDDYYLLDFGFGNYLVTEDEFYQGQQFSFSYFYDDQVGPGDQVTVSLMGVDRDFYNYMDLVIDQSEENAGPFQVPVATARGNIINVTESASQEENNENFALGYFAIVGQSQRSLILE